ncbi:hypothetical protein TNCV_641641 [Trichonephila clavipes]|nr:hypothetical protein TNCV_641641 [Trichonephila clavipes]
MLKDLRFDIFGPQETKLLVLLFDSTNERRLVQGHEATPPWMKGVSSDLDNRGLRLHYLDETPINPLLSSSINLKYEAISVPQGSVYLVKKTQERKSSPCYLLITKGVTSSSRVPIKTHREGKMHVKSVESSNVLLLEWCGS